MPRLVSLITVLLLGLASALLLLTAGCNRAKQADNSEQSTPVAQQGAQSARSGRLVDEQNLPGGEEGDQATAGEAQESGTEAEAGSSDEEDEAAEGEDQQNGDDEGDESVDENGDGSGEDEGGEGTEPGEEPEPSEPGDETDGEEGNEEDEPPAPNPDIDAAAIYQAAMCADCHGGELDGTQRGPSLKNLDKYWDAVELGQFLKSPAYYSEGNQRLIDLAHQYNIAMPPLHRSDDEIYALAHWLLNQ